MIQGKDFIFFSEMDWEDLWTRKQQFAKMFGAGGNRVLYVEPHESLIFLLRRGKWGKLARSFLPLKKPVQNVWVVSPFPALPFDGASQVINFINNILLRLHVKLLCLWLSIQNPILFIYMPQNYRLAGALNECLSVYDIVDERAEYPGRHKRYIDHREKLLLQNVDLVLVVSVALKELKGSLHERIHVVPNAADTKLFESAQRKELEIASEIRDLPQPRIGFVGGIHEWVDFDLLIHIAQMNPHWSIVLVGPRGVDLSNLLPMKNIHWVDKQPQKRLPEFLRGFDCCVIPYCRNRLKHYSGPLKLFEYLAAGKPVVSVDMPAVHEFRDVVRIAQTHDEFIKSIEESIEEDSLEESERRIRATTGHDWSDRFQEVNRIIVHYQNLNDFST